MIHGSISQPGHTLQHSPLLEEGKMTSQARVIPSPKVRLQGLGLAGAISDRMSHGFYRAIKADLLCQLPRPDERSHRGPGPELLLSERDCLLEVPSWLKMLTCADAHMGAAPSALLSGF